MKFVPIILTLLLFASPLFAQQPSISYLMCDEAKSQLQIHGSFGIDSGSVSIEDTTLGIVSWSDTLIICNLPDSGRGAGGHVEVQTKNGVSNKRALSIFSMIIDHTFWTASYNSNGVVWTSQYAQRWEVNWRADIAKRKNDVHSIPFEISKSSFGHYFDGHGPRDIMPTVDSSIIPDSGISLNGIMNLDSFVIDFGFASIYTRHDSIFGKRYLYPEYHPLSIRFDTTGMIEGYRDIYTNDSYPGTKRTDSLYNAQILYPPSLKSAVTYEHKPTDLIKIWSQDRSVMMHSETSLGPLTASLYTIDGKLLKQTKLDITAAGNYSIDLSDLRMRFLILVLQTSKGVITKKILF